MRIYQVISFITTAFILSMNVLAASQSRHEQLQLPQCLATKLANNYPVLAENKQFKIIDLPVTAFDDLALLADKTACGRFINVTHHLKTNDIAEQKQLAQKQLLKPLLKASSLRSAHYKIHHEAEVKSALEKIDTANIFQTLSHLTHYYNRSATKKTGLQVAQWLQKQFTTLAMAAGREDTATYFVATGNYLQPSLVTVIGKDNTAPAIVIGAHMDTLNGRMPGAGDDGSGSAVIMELARILLDAQVKFKRPIYIIWYAAEERGLVGSQHVVQDFLAKAIPVKAVIQFDMAGYRSNENDPTMWVFRDYTDKSLNNFVAKLIKTYVKVPVNYSKCGYGCSDHASWMAEGIPAVFPVETSFANHNPYIHTASDTLSLLNTDHLANFTKLGLAFAIELASD